MSACASQPRELQVRGAAPWPEADVLFHRDPNWLGSDAAYSIPMSGGRVLWLFGDTFVATGGSRGRHGSVMVRNSVAMQRGRDPGNAEMHFFWNRTASKPQSYFSETGDNWYWPLHGAQLPDGTLIIFLARLRATPGEGLGFAADGWCLARVGAADAARDPDTWRPECLELTEGPARRGAGIVLGTAVFMENDYLYAIATREPGHHAGMLVRWKLDSLQQEGADGFAAMEWWMGATRGFVENRRIGMEAPAIVLDDASPECSVHRDAATASYLHVASLGFGAAWIGVRQSGQPYGPWSRARALFLPEEAGRKDVIVYAAKAHPELETGSPRCLAVTYATNTLHNFSLLVDDMTLYFPRFIRIEY